MPSDKGKNRFESVGDLVRIFQRGRHWYANYQWEGKQHRPSLKTTSKKEARRRAIQLEAKLLEGRCQRPLAPTALADVVRDYGQFLRTEGRAPKTLVKYYKILDACWISPTGAVCASSTPSRSHSWMLIGVSAFRPALPPRPSTLRGYLESPGNPGF
jgi:hypothetical protein